MIDVKFFPFPKSKSMLKRYKACCLWPERNTLLLRILQEALMHVKNAFTMVSQVTVIQELKLLTSTEKW